ncbi:STAS domain-containing protein [Rhodoferax aquaticus]|uniref:STAS domain-containing protein n=1 Tax=Rhodoferax aquaticus TaxID=2527691 RepID=A0A515ELL8_9BURK|nr:STAS domain-containing protein [Rhodoferax aquaticus]QDL53541.1 STAS domain-containing protein [Rhodoferax aquaticus]
MLSLPATLTQNDASACLEQLTAGLRSEAAQVVVDAARLRSFDTSALAVLLALRRECARAGKHFTVQGLPQRLRDLASLYGVESLLPSA